MQFYCLQLCVQLHLAAPHKTARGPLTPQASYEIKDKRKSAAFINWNVLCNMCSTIIKSPILGQALTFGQGRKMFLHARARMQNSAQRFEWKI